MIKHTIYTVLISFFMLLMSCGGSRQALESGDYDKVVTNASIALKKNKDNKSQALLLEEAFKKATDRDIALIEQYKADVQHDETKWFDIYNIYDRMLIREIAVAPLLPLHADGRELIFDIPNVDREAEEAKAKASKALYNKALALLQNGDKQSARKAYTLFDNLVEFNFTYMDARDRRDEAKLKGSTNVLVETINNTGKPFPSTFEEDLMTFREGSFTDPWIQYHKKRKPGINYEYSIDLNITDVIVGRDNRQQRQYREQNRVIVGYKTGKNSKGENVRVPQYATVYADVLETLQTKPVGVAGEVIYKKANGSVLQTIPVKREEAWQNNYAEFRGDQRALSQETIEKIRNGEKQYPTDEQLYEISGKLLNQVVVRLFEEHTDTLK